MQTAGNQCYRSICSITVLGINTHALSIHTVPIGEGTLRYGMGSSSQPVHLENVYCSGDEDNILQCSHKEIGCSHETDAGVICEGTCVHNTTHLQNLYIPTAVFQLNQVVAEMVTYV